jgi:regulator of RNase E activity RraA
MVCDNDGAIVIPAAMAAEVAEAGVEQERFERFVQQRVAEGASVVGLYPPDQGTLADYQRWRDAGEP